MKYTVNFVCLYPLVRLLPLVFLFIYLIVLFCLFVYRLIIYIINNRRYTIHLRYVTLDNNTIHRTVAVPKKLKEKEKYLIYFPFKFLI